MDIGELQIDTETMKLVLMYCQHHGFESPPPVPMPIEKPSLKDIFEPWDKDFVEDLDDDLTLKLCLAAKSLGIASLVQLLTASIALTFRNKDENSVGEMLNSECHMEPSEELYLKGTFEWALTSTGVRKQDEDVATEGSAIR